MTSSDNVRVIALHLPQFHPIPENDEWWGKGFTEWTNTAKAKPLFPGHYQPHVPADLGFYDLRLPEARRAQADLAREYGIEAFCYYHYWFGGRQLLERPFNEIVRSGEPDFPFCLCWANETWTGIWHGNPKTTLVEQVYPGEHDFRAHFEHLLPAFRDRRYVKVDGMPVFVVYKLYNFPNVAEFCALWQQLAVEAGLPGIFFVAVEYESLANPLPKGFQARVYQNFGRGVHDWVPWTRPIKKLMPQLARKAGLPTIRSYKTTVEGMYPKQLSDDRTIPMVIPNWDNTPRSGARGLMLKGSTPDLFRDHVRSAVELVQHVPAERRFLFVKSWNEWAEGNHLEPDLKYGRGYLEALRDATNGKR